MVKNLEAQKGKKMIIRVSFDERGTPFKRSPTLSKISASLPQRRHAWPRYEHATHRDVPSSLPD